MPESAIQQLADQRRQAAGRLHLFDTSLWLGRPRGFPLACEMDIRSLRSVMTESFINGGLISHWDGHGLSAQEGNAALLSLDLNAGNVDLGVILTGLPLFPAEGGPLPGHDTLPEAVRAVRVFPKTHAFPMTDWMLDSLVSWMTERGMPMFIWHTELEWNELHTFARAFPQLAIVVESQYRKIIYHLRPLLMILRECANVFLEISNLTGPAFDLTLQYIGPERLVFGSFLPVNDPFVPLGMILDSGLTDEDRRLIAGGNLRRLIGKGVS